jgi:hypothetical protein
MRRWFLSYNSQDLALMQVFEAGLKRKDPEARIFFAPESLPVGGFWLPELANEIAEATVLRRGLMQIAQASCRECGPRPKLMLGGSKSALVTEEVIGIGRYGKTLTVLSSETIGHEDEEEEAEEDTYEKWETPRFRR